MPRYAKQPRDSSCGPTAVLNAAKWAGLGLSIKHDFDFMADLCGTDWKIGTYPSGIERGLRVALGLNGVKVTRKRYATVRNIEKLLSKGGAAVACNDDHVFLITGQTEKMFIVQNYREGPTTCRIRKTTLEKKMVPHEVWFLKNV